MVERAEEALHHYSELSKTYAAIAVANRRRDMVFTVIIGVLTFISTLGGASSLYVTEVEGGALEWAVAVWRSLVVVVLGVASAIAGGMDFRNKKNRYATASMACDEAVTSMRVVVDHKGEASDALVLSQISLAASAADAHLPLVAPKTKKE